MRKAAAIAGMAMGERMFVTRRKKDTHYGHVFS
jgi:hypothetical protein